MSKLDYYAYKLVTFEALILTMIWDQLIAPTVLPMLFNDDPYKRLKYCDLSHGAWILFHGGLPLPSEMRQHIIRVGYLHMFLIAAKLLIPVYQAVMHSLVRF